MFRVTKGMMGPYLSPSSLRQIKKKKRKSNALCILSLTGLEESITWAGAFFPHSHYSTHPLTAIYVSKAEPKLLLWFFYPDATYIPISAVNPSQQHFLSLGYLYSAEILF